MPCAWRVSCRLELCVQLWNLVADGAGSDIAPTPEVPSYPRSATWSFFAARLLLALRQSDYTFIIVREEMVERVVKWVRCPTLPQRTYGTGLLLCT